MFICLCNGLTDRQIRAHIAYTGCSVAALYRRLGVAPKCGKCVAMVREIIEQANEVADDPQPVSLLAAEQ